MGPRMRLPTGRRNRPKAGLDQPRLVGQDHRLHAVAEAQLLALSPATQQRSGEQALRPTRTDQSLLNVGTATASSTAVGQGCSGASR